jgi:hypothetical protein
MRLVTAALAAALVLLASARADAEWWDEVNESNAQELTLNCGEIKNSNSSWQVGRYNWLEYLAETRRSVNGYCPWIYVGVEAWVVGVSNSARSDWDLFTASVGKQVPVPSYGYWQVKGNHYRSWLGVFTYSNGSSSSSVSVEYKGEEDPNYNPDDPLPVTNDPYNPNIVSPIIVDAARTGFQLTSVDDGVLFDIDADGHLDRVAWTAADGDDEFLVMDRNGNGRIDDGSELFGNYTPVFPDAEVTAENGFDALRFLEGPSFGRAAIDQVIDGKDSGFAALRLWRDANHNGISEPEELRTLHSAGLLALETEYKLSGRRDRYGNEFRQRARALVQHGAIYVYDVWLGRQ